MKGFYRLVAVGGITVFTSSVYAGSGCNYGNFQAEAAPRIESGPVVGRIDESRVDPKWLALLKEREEAETGPQPIVVHN